MKNKNNNQFLLAMGVAFVAVALFAFNFLVTTASTSGEDVMVEIQVAPSILQRYSKGEYVIVHTDINKSLVIDATLRLNDVGVLRTKADDRGNIVGYFDLEMITDKVNWNLKSMTMTLTGSLVAGGNLEGSDRIILE
ncbi:hypothetical protein MUP65_02650 [Patescibacteria group bacterium]|nr:hypothetical protein [Patescibacteria group bacterium]